MTAVRSWLARLLPQTWVASLERGSCAWALVRPCGFSRNLWETGSIRGKASGAPAPAHTAARYSEMIASTSISTSIAGSISRLTCTIVAAGRISRKYSPCARPTFSQSAISVT